MATTNTKSTSTPAPGRGGREAASSIGFLVIAGVVLVLANVAGHYLFGRIDLTPNKMYTLSQGSRRLVSELDDTLEVTVYHTSDLPPPWNANERAIRDILEEYKAAGGANFRLRWVDPDTEDEKQEARDAGVIEAPLGARNTTSLTVRQGFVGLVMSYLGETKAIPFIQSTEGLEYEISRRIQEITQDPIVVGVVSGHGSPTLEQGLGAIARGLPAYELRSVDASQEIDRELKALLIVDPTEEFNETELRRINQYVMNGGSLGVFGGGLNVTIEQMGASARPATTGLNTMLGRWGIEIGEGMVADWVCIRVPMRTPIGLPAYVPFPAVPRVIYEEEAQEHPVTFRLPYAAFFFSSPIRVNDTFHRLDGTILGSTSEEASWILSGDTIDLSPRDPREWDRRGASGPHHVLVALNKELPSAFTGAMSTPEGGDAPPAINAPERSQRRVRVVVGGTGTLFRDEFIPQQQGEVQLTESLSTALNAIDWLAQDEDLIAVRAKSVEDPPIDVPESVERAARETEEAAATAEEDGGEAAERAQERLQDAIEAWDAKKRVYQIFLGGGVPLLVALFGLLWWYLRSRRRITVADLRARVGADAKKS